MRTILLLCVVFSVASSALLTESGGMAEGEIDGVKLVKLGRKTNQPLLTLLGIAIRNLHRCELWSSWSNCEASAKNYFGTRTRTRSCVQKSETEADSFKNETDVGLCEGSCPLYVGTNVTSHGYCIKLHLTQLTHSEAEIYCKGEGGYLINIDSEQKYEDVKAMLKGFSSTLLNVGGRRQSASSPWKFQYGSQTPSIKWESNEPDNGYNDLCLLYHSSNHLWYDGECRTRRPFLCEYV